MVQTVQRPPPRVSEASEILPIVLKLSPLIELTEEQFAEFCGLNRDLRIERTANGELEIMSPTKGFTGATELDIAAQVREWNRRYRGGMAFGPSMGYTLPNGAVRSPDASWVSLSRLSDLTSEDENRFLPVCPDFVVELRSDTDRLNTLRAKMEEYMENGARLGWLIDPHDRRVYTYRSGQDVEILESPDSVSADPVLPGFTLKLREIWDPWHWLATENDE